MYMYGGGIWLQGVKNKKRSNNLVANKYHFLTARWRKIVSVFFLFSFNKALLSYKIVEYSAYKVERKIKKNFLQCN